MKTISSKPFAPIHNDNLGKMKAMNVKTPPAPIATEAPEPHISETAKVLNNEPTNNASPNPPNDTSAEAAKSAHVVAKTLTSLPNLPISTANENSKTVEAKINDKPVAPKAFIQKPAIIFIEGFSAFGISDGDGIKDMADNTPDAKRFSWDEQDLIVDEIKKHAPDRPVILVGHSFGGTSAVEIANTLNSAKNGFRTIDLLVSIDSVGMNNNIIPMNVKRNLNFFGEGTIPFLHGSPNIARDTDHTTIINELSPELHSRMDDSEKVQFKIFESMNEVLNKNKQDGKQPDLFTEMQKRIGQKDFIDSQSHHLKP